jgi:acyl carrier protein
MKEQEVKSILMDHLDGRLRLFGISPAELDGDFDLVRSGLLDSMAFVDLVGALEEKLGVQIDFEKVMEDERFTTVSGLLGLFIFNLNE